MLPVCLLVPLLPSVVISLCLLIVPSSVASSAFLLQVCLLCQFFLSVVASSVFLLLVASPHCQFCLSVASSVYLLPFLSFCCQFCLPVVISNAISVFCWGFGLHASSRSISAACWACPSPSRTASNLGIFSFMRETSDNPPICWSVGQTTFHSIK